MKAKDLTPGQEFKLKGKRKFRTVKKVFECDLMKGSPIAYAGKLLIVFEDCMQMILDPEAELILKPCV